MKKINKKGLITLLVFSVSTLIVFYDLLTIITHFNATWTYWGIFTFCISAVVMELSYEYLESKIKDTD